MGRPSGVAAHLTPRLGAAGEPSPDVEAGRRGPPAVPTPAQPSQPAKVAEGGEPGGRPLGAHPSGLPSPAPASGLAAQGGSKDAGRACGRGARGPWGAPHPHGRPFLGLPAVSVLPQLRDFALS